MTILHKCPRCGSGNTSRSRRKRMEHLLIGIKPFRCNDCQRRFFSHAIIESIRRSPDRKSRRTPLL